MRCTLKAKCSKDVFLDNTFMSIESKQRDGYTYGFYHNKKYAKEDSNTLRENANVSSEILTGWEVDGFITLT